ncbi:MAG: histidine--tRNA ligase [Deltaproteobacteria bacterium]|nr:MAG: histidine--tRNA ligase [Deltaproteobacteria bacterium]
MQYKAVKGFKDILPSQVKTWDRVESEGKRIFELFGYREIRIPILEKAELFARGIGQDTDIVSKEMYTLTDRRGAQLAMRPEATASILRAYIENKLYAATPVHKLFTIGPMFRYERPQKGRRRQFHQIDVEIIGDPGPRSDSELMFMIMHFFTCLGLAELILHVNSLGCMECRGPFRAELKRYLQEHVEQLCPDCQESMETKPLRVFDCKVERCIQVMKDAPTMLDFLCRDCTVHFDAVKVYLRELNIDFVVNSHLMRGLDYYTRTTFEVQTRELGAQNAVAGGGRYDLLMKELGGPDSPAIGFAIGEERVVELLEEQGRVEADGPDIFLAPLGTEAEDKAFMWLQELRKAGLRCEMDYRSSGLKAQMKHGDRLGARKVLIVGQDELAKGKGILRDMSTKSQMEISLEDPVKEIIRLKEERWQ